MQCLSGYGVSVLGMCEVSVCEGGCNIQCPICPSGDTIRAVVGSMCSNEAADIRDRDRFPLPSL